MQQPTPSSTPGTASSLGPAAMRHVVAVAVAFFASDRRPAPDWVRQPIRAIATRGMRWMDDRRTRRDEDLFGR